MNTITFNNTTIGDNQPAYIIAEIGQAHDGSLGSAYAYVKAVAETGVDAVKFQTHIARAESTKHEKFRVKVFPQDDTRYDYWKRMEFTKEQWRGLAKYTRELGLEFLSTPFSIEAVELLDELEVPVWKVGSGDILNNALINAMIKTRKPILLSSGMSTTEDLDVVTKNIKSHSGSFALFQCTTSYPCPPEEIGYNILSEFKDKFNCPVGLSDHSGTIFPSLAAVTLGAKMIEVHAVFSKRCFGPDTSSSLEIDELSELVKGIRFIEKGLSNPVDKGVAENERKEVKVLFSRSAFYTKDLKTGDVFDETCFAMKKPGGGLTLDEANKLIGKVISSVKLFDDFVQVEDFS